MTGHWYVASWSNTAERSSKNTVDSAWLPGQHKVTVRRRCKATEKLKRRDRCSLSSTPQHWDCRDEGVQRPSLGCWWGRRLCTVFDRGLTHLLHSELHWLDVPERIQHKLGVTVHRCLQGKTPQYLIECCTPTSEVASRQRLRSASRHQLVVPRYRRSKFGRRAFSVAGPMVWNSLPDHLRDPTLSSDCFKSRLKAEDTLVFAVLDTQRIRGIA